MLKFIKRKIAEMIEAPEPPKPTKPIKPPSKNQLEECDRLGLVVEPNMDSRDVGELLKEAKKDPEIKKKYDAYVAEKNAIVEAEEREEFGDAIVDEVKKWEKICSPGTQYMVVFKKGKTTSADILEFDYVNIEGEKRYYIKIVGLRPKIYKPRNESPYIEWIKEISFRPQQILFLKQLENSIDMLEIGDYEKALQEANEIKEKYL